MADSHNQTNISPIWLQTLKSLTSEMLEFVCDEEGWASLHCYVLSHLLPQVLCTDVCLVFENSV